MKYERYFFIPSNWRFHVVMFFVMFSVLLLAADSGSLIAFFMSKLIGVVVFLAAALLFWHWDVKGLMDDVKNIEE